MTDEEKLKKLDETAGIREGLVVPYTPDQDPVVLGCTDSMAGNYSPLANKDDGTCWYYAAPSGGM